MASAFAHVFAAATLGTAMVPRPRARVVAAGVVCSVLPDVDVVGFWLGVAYGDLLGHRGLSHSLPFAVAIALLLTPLVARVGEKLRVGVYLFLATASHGLFDALTNGGLGVAFLSPFDPTRWFLPFRPVLVSPIGVTEFFSARAVPLLATELLWIALPWSLLCIAIASFTRSRADAGKP